MGLCGEDIALEMRLFTLSPSVTFRPPQSAKRSLPIKEFHGIEACRKRLGLILTIASAGIKLSISAYIASFFNYLRNYSYICSSNNFRSILHIFR